MSQEERVNVSLRLRPLNNRERENQEKIIWKCTENSVYLDPRAPNYLQHLKKTINTSQVFQYNKCFGPSFSNRDVFNAVIRPVVSSSLQGFNATVFAYGQTGSGKTFTLMGSDSANQDTMTSNRNDRRTLKRSNSKTSQHNNSRSFNEKFTRTDGIIFMALQELFSYQQQFNSASKFKLTISYLEIYNEHVYDLFSNTKQFNQLQIVEDQQRNFQVKGAVQFDIYCIEQAMELINLGEHNRHYASTSMNHHSSRSHTVFRIQISYIKYSESTQNCFHIESLLNFIDLAGSERVNNIQEIQTQPPKVRQQRKKSTASSPRNQETLLNEGKHINKSLFHLCQVIMKLAEAQNCRQDSHIPYRNSNLTKILSSSLGGNSLTRVICTATPTATQYELTLSTLRFGGKAQTITNKVAQNIKGEKSMEVLKNYQDDIRELKEQLKLTQQGRQIIIEKLLGEIQKLEAEVQREQGALFDPKSCIPSQGQFQILELWYPDIGDIMIDEKLLSKKQYGNVLNPGQYRLKAKNMMAYAIQKIQQQRQLINRYETQISFIQQNNGDIKQSQGFLQDEFNQLQLRQQRNERQIESQQKQIEQLDNQIEQMRQRIDIIQNQENFEKLNIKSLKKLEIFFYKGLDTVKNAKFKQLYTSQLQDTQNETSTDYENSRQILQLQRVKSHDTESSFNSAASTKRSVLQRKQFMSLFHSDFTEQSLLSSGPVTFSEFAAELNISKN